MNTQNDVSGVSEAVSEESSLMTPEQASDYVTRTDPRFELADEIIRGVPYRVFRNAPPHLRALLQQAEAAYEDRDVMVYQGERWNYAQFSSEVCRIAQALNRRIGIRPGDRVALAMRNYPELPILILAVTALGAVVVPLNSWGSEEELAFALEDSDAKLAFADGPRFERLKNPAAKRRIPLLGVREADLGNGYRELLADVPSAEWPHIAIAPDDDFAVLYSSGSTGKPKGVVLTHRGAITTLYSWAAGRTMAPLVTGDPVDPDAPPPSFLVVTPLFHVTALHAIFLQGIHMGARLTLMYKWDPEEAIRLIKAENITRFVGVPTQTADLMEAARRLNEPLESLVSVGSGGAKRPAAQVSELADTFPQAIISSGWGMTETNSLGIIASGPDYVDNPESAGTPTPPVQEIQIVDERGRPLPTAQVGELIVKSPANMRCYLNQPEATADALRDGWLFTGDLAKINEDGLVFIVDRKKTLIIRGGENIACLEVEGALHRHPDVIEACVFPVPDARLGETVGAAVNLKEDSSVTEAELISFLKQHIAPFKVPDRIWFWPEPLPKGATDKINRRALREQCLALAGE